MITDVEDYRKPTEAANCVPIVLNWQTPRAVSRIRQSQNHTSLPLHNSLLKLRALLSEFLSYWSYNWREVLIHDRGV